MNACPVCRYHSGPLSRRQQMCPYIHLYKAVPVVTRDPIDRDEEVPSSAYSQDAAVRERCGCAGGLPRTNAGDPIEDDACDRCGGEGWL